MLKVYVAGPIGPVGPKQRENVDAALALGHELHRRGFASYVPHLNWFYEQAHPREREEWLRHDFEWVKQCDALLRMPGHSPGSDEEVETAKKADIPVFYEIDALEAWARNHHDHVPTLILPTREERTRQIVENEFARAVAENPADVLKRAKDRIVEMSVQAEDFHDELCDAVYGKEETKNWTTTESPSQILKDVELLRSQAECADAAAAQLKEARELLALARNNLSQWNTADLGRRIDRFLRNAASEPPQSPVAAALDDPPGPPGWKWLDAPASPSGKTQWLCNRCGNLSAGHDKWKYHAVVCFARPAQPTEAPLYRIDVKDDGTWLHLSPPGGKSWSVRLEGTAHGPIAVATVANLRTALSKDE